MKLLTIFIVLSLAGSFAGADPAVTGNAVVDLYAQRLELVKLDLERQKIQTEYLLAVKTSIESAVGAVPERSIREARLNYDLGLIQIKSLETRAKEASALLEIAKMRIQRGIDMPLCQESK